MRKHKTLSFFLGLSLLLSALSGCSNEQPRSFAGFTFGGGGNTFSAEPATIIESPEQSILKAGNSGDPVYLELTWNTDPELESAAPRPLTGATITVSSQGGPTTLEDGDIVLQSKSGNIVHGSFDLTTKAQDGREFKVVGSFTAEQ
jgi:hypothetical protein